MTGGIVGSLPSGAPIRPRVKYRIPCGNSSRSKGLRLSAAEDAKGPREGGGAYAIKEKNNVKMTFGKKRVGTQC